MIYERGGWGREGWAGDGGRVPGPPSFSASREMGSRDEVKRRDGAISWDLQVGGVQLLGASPTCWGAWLRKDTPPRPFRPTPKPVLLSCRRGELEHRTSRVDWPSTPGCLPAAVTTVVTHCPLPASTLGCRPGALGLEQRPPGTGHCQGPLAPPTLSLHPAPILGLAIG